MIASSVSVAVGIFLLLIGGKVLIDNSISLSLYLKLPPFLIGLTVVAWGTSSPELFVNISSIVKGYSDLSIYNILGSNICNICCVFGLFSFVRPKFKKQYNVLKLDLSFLLVSVLLIISILSDNVITQVEGMILIVVFLIYIVITIRSRSSYVNSREVFIDRMILRAACWLVFGMLLLILGSRFALNNAINLANKAGIVQDIISLVGISIGTSFPEIVTSIIAMLHNEFDIVIGNILGSNLFNALFIIGATGLVFSLHCSHDIKYTTLLVLILSTVFIVLYLRIKKMTAKSTSIIPLIFYVFFIYTMYIFYD